MHIYAFQVPAEFFRIVLGPHLKYSCGLFRCAWELFLNVHFHKRFCRLFKPFLENAFLFQIQLCNSHRGRGGHAGGLRGKSSAKVSSKSQNWSQFFFANCSLFWTGMGWIFLTLAAVGAPWLYSLLPGLYLSHFDDFYKVFALVHHYPPGSQAAGWRPCPTRTSRESTSRSRPRRGASPTLTLSLEMLPRWWWWLILILKVHQEGKGQRGWQVYLISIFLNRAKIFAHFRIKTTWTEAIQSWNYSNWPFTL